MSFLHDSDKQAKPMPSGLSGLVPPRSNPTLLRKQTPSVLSDPTSFETKKSDVQNHAQGPEMSFLHDSDKQAKPTPSGLIGLVPPRSNPTLLRKQTPSVLSDSTSFETKKSDVQNHAQGPEMSFLHDSDKQAKPTPSGLSGLVPPRSNPTLLRKQTPSVLSDPTSFETKKSDVQNQPRGPEMSFLHDSDKQAKPMPSGSSGLVPPRSNPTLLRKQTPSVLSDSTSFETKKSDVQNHAQGPEMSFLHDSDKQAKPMPSGSSGLVPPRSNPTLLTKQTPSVFSDSTSCETEKSDVQDHAPGAENSKLSDSCKLAKPKPRGLIGLVPPRSMPTLFTKQTPSVLSDSVSFEIEKSDVQNHAPGAEKSILGDSCKQAKPTPSGLSGLVPPRSMPTLTIKQTRSILSDSTSFEIEKSDVQNHAQGPEMSLLNDSCKPAKPKPRGLSGPEPARNKPTMSRKRTASFLSHSVSSETDSSDTENQHLEQNPDTPQSPGEMANTTHSNPKEQEPVQCAPTMFKKQTESESGNFTDSETDSYDPPNHHLEPNREMSKSRSGPIQYTPESKNCLVPTPYTTTPLETHERCETRGSAKIEISMSEMLDLVVVINAEDLVPMRKVINRQTESPVGARSIEGVPYHLESPEKTPVSEEHEDTSQRRQDLPQTEDGGIRSKVFEGHHRLTVRTDSSDLIIWTPCTTQVWNSEKKGRNSDHEKNEPGTEIRGCMQNSPWMSTDTPVKDERKQPKTLRCLFGEQNISIDPGKVNRTDPSNQQKNFSPIYDDIQLEEEDEDPHAPMTPEILEISTPASPNDVQREARIPQCYHALETITETDSDTGGQASIVTPDRAPKSPILNEDSENVRFWEMNSESQVTSPHSSTGPDETVFGTPPPHSESSGGKNNEFWGEGDSSLENALMSRTDLIMLYGKNYRNFDASEIARDISTSTDSSENFSSPSKNLRFRRPSDQKIKSWESDQNSTESYPEEPQVPENRIPKAGKPFSSPEGDITGNFSLEVHVDYTPDTNSNALSCSTAQHTAMQSGSNKVTNGWQLSCSDSGSDSEYLCAVTHTNERQLSDSDNEPLCAMIHTDEDEEEQEKPMSPI